MNTRNHAAQCSVCAHDERQEIEAAYIARKSLPVLEAEYDLPQGSLKRHARAFPTLRRQRADNLIGLCDEIIERGIDALAENPDVPLAMVEKFAHLRAKLTGAIIDVTKVLNDAFPGRSEAEVAFFADHGRWPTEADIQDGSEQVQ